jgi:hypothetical protein
MKSARATARHAFATVSLVAVMPACKKKFDMAGQYVGDVSMQASRTIGSRSETSSGNERVNVTINNNGASAHFVIDHPAGAAFHCEGDGAPGASADGAVIAVTAPTCQWRRDPGRDCTFTPSFIRLQADASGLRLSMGSGETHGNQYQCFDHFASISPLAAPLARQ